MRLLPLLLCAPVLCVCVSAQSLNYTYDSVGHLSSVTYPNGKTLSYTYDPNGNLIRRLVSSTLAGPTPLTSAAAVVNAASFLGGPVAPGELVTIFGTGIGPSTLQGLQLTPFNFVDTYTGETSILFDGIPAPLVYASGTQTTAIVPYSVAGNTSTQMVVVYQGRRSAPVTLPVTQAVPALFSADSSGKGNGAILNQDNSKNSPANPAEKGSIVVLYGTGEGQTSPRGADGRVASQIFPTPLLSLTATVGDLPAEIAYGGAAPLLVAGVLQVNVKIPLGVASGAVPITIFVGGVPSQSGLTVSVR